MIDARTYARYAHDPAAFRADLHVDVSGVVRRFGDVMDPWQRDDFAAMDPGLMRCNGRASRIPPGTGIPVKCRAYAERARGHSKSSDLAVMSCWALAFADRPIKGYAYAADKDQADILRQAMETVIRLNPWLGSIFRVQHDSVVNVAQGHRGEGGRLAIETSDVASSYGINPDLLIADELVHWGGDGSLWHSIMSSAGKRENCMLVVISNAGFLDRWQWAVREAARTDEAWYFSRQDGPVASWMTPARLAEQARMLPPVAYARVWLNRWSSGGGDALTREDIAAAFDADLSPITRRKDGWVYVAGVDLGVSRDGSAVVVLAVPEGGKAGQIRLAHARLWRPVNGRKIDLMAVESHILDLDKLFYLEEVGFDPWQAESMAQRLEVHSKKYRRLVRGEKRPKLTPWMREMTPTGKNLQIQATLILESFTDHRLKLYPDENLRRDLDKLRVEERSYGFRLTSPRDGHGHGDTYSAFANALTVAHEYAGRGMFRRSVPGSAPREQRALRAALDKSARDAEREERMREEYENPHSIETALKNGTKLTRLT